MDTNGEFLYKYFTVGQSTLLIREVVDGKRQVRRVKYQPTLFTPCKNESGYKTLTGQNAAPIKFDNIKEAKEWTKQYENQKHLVLGKHSFHMSICLINILVQ